MSAFGEPVFGNEYQLMCIANGTILPTVTWLNENGSQINESNLIVIRTTVSSDSIVSTLTFNPLKFAHDGLYTCLAVLVSRNNTLRENDTFTVSVKCKIQCVVSFI